MSNSNDTKNLFQVIKEAPGKMLNYISGGVSRIFSPRDDDYPDTGVQPLKVNHLKRNIIEEGFINNVETLNVTSLCCYR
ncbi:MAG: hypothetical protein HC908_18745 [Calothrix sp. SM1_7_51]|nr:hypothetical protein [Calothrix sp. SM1_7_51]